MAHLSEIELYYSSPENINDGIAVIAGEEFHHAVDVMRNKKNSLIYVTDGEGNLYKCIISNISKIKLTAEIKSKEYEENNNRNIHFCIPYLKNPERMKFAIEKSVELGITSFILFSSKRTVAKSANINRLRKITLSAMKQSLHFYLPQISESTLREISKSPDVKIVLDQKADTNFSFKNDSEKDYYFLFGPEGGFDKSELEIIKPDNFLCLDDHRLRTETAIINCAALISII